MRAKYKLLITFLFTTALPAVAQWLSVSESEARQTAAAFLTQTGGKATRTTASELTLQALVERSFYLYRQAASRRFVAVAADSRLPAVLGYGESTAEAEPDDVRSLPDGLRSLAKAYRQAAETGGFFAAPCRREAVLPLVKSVRHQYAPFNDACPYYQTGGAPSAERTLVGCVATALEQILSAYRQPAALRDTLHGWTTPYYIIEDVLPGTAIHWEKIRDRYDDDHTPAQTQAVADLSYWCGIAAKMNWGLSASGASLHPLPAVLRRAFGYGYAHCVSTCDYRPADWLALLYGELRTGRPLLYAGYTSLREGHAFVVDGFDEDGRFHVNWGYGGAYDGYFDLSVLNPFELTADATPTGKYVGFYANQEAILLYPDSVDQPLIEPLERTRDSIAVDSVRLLRPADTHPYVTMRLFVRNLSDQPATHLLQLYTCAPDDPTRQETADAVALAALTLEAHAADSVETYGRFTLTGDRTLVVAGYRDTLLYSRPLHVSEAPAGQLSFDALQIDTLSHNCVRVRVSVHNAPDAGWAGSCLTFSLFEGEALTPDTDRRHWRFLNLPAGETATEFVAFQGLAPQTTYTFIVRHPWQPAAQLVFTTSAVPLGLTPLLPSPTPSAGASWFTLSGVRLVSPPQKGIFIRQESGKTQRIQLR